MVVAWLCHERQTENRQVLCVTAETDCSQGRKRTSFWNMFPVSIDFTLRKGHSAIHTLTPGSAVVTVSVKELLKKKKKYFMRYREARDQSPHSPSRRETVSRVKSK